MFQYSLGAICCVLLVLSILVIVLLVSVFSGKETAEVAVTVDSNGDSGGVAVNVNLNFDEDKSESPLIHSDLTDAGAGAPISGSAGPGPGQTRPWPPGDRKWNRNAPAASDTVFPVFPSYTVTVPPPKWAPINTGPGVGAGAGAPSRRLQQPDSSEEQ